MGRGANRFERSARFWLRAYPRRWRRDRGDEVVGVLLELAGVGLEPAAVPTDPAAPTDPAVPAAPTDPAVPAAPTALNRGIGPRAALDLVRHGWATRLREHPPLHLWLGYRLLDLHLPDRYRDWTADDIDGALYLQRTFAYMWVIGAVMLLAGDYSRQLALAWFVLPEVYQAIPPFIRWRRRQARERHLVLGPGEPLVHGSFVAMAEPQHHAPASWAAPRVLALDLTALAVALVAVLLAPTGGGGFDTVFGAPGAARGVVVGALAAIGGASYVWHARVRAALATALADLPAQPHRVVEWPGRGRDVALGVALVLIVGWAVGEVVGQWELSLSPFVGALGAAHLPRALAMATAARRVGNRAPDGSPLAWVDLSAVAATRRPPRPYQPGRVVRRWDGPTVPGQVVLGPRHYGHDAGGAPDPFRLA